MAFMQNNNFGNNNNNNGNGTGEKKSFKLGRIYASDGQVDLGIYISTSATWVTVLAMKAIGTNPSTGMMAMEQAQPQQLPSVMLSTEAARAFIDAVTNAEPSTLNFTINSGGKYHSSITVQGSPSDVKITIKDDRGDRQVSLTAMPVGTKNIFASWNNFIDLIKVGFKKSLRHKMNPEEFSAEIGSSDSDEVPFS